jgi:hypothetical protein
MTYIDDSVPITTFVIPGTHNSGAVDVKLLNILPLNWLNCQLDGFYAQACAGSRSFDIRVQMWGDEIFCAHGVGTGIRLDIGLQDLRRFHDEYPSEVMFLTIWCYYDQSDIDPAVISPIIEDCLQPLTYAFPSTFPMGTATMGEIRAAGRCFAIYSQWVREGYSAQGRPGVGTFTDDSNFGGLDDGYKLYDYLRELLQDQPGYYVLAVNRASGDAPEKHAPLDFMLSDRELYLQFMRELQTDPVMLPRVVGVDMDCITFDLIQSGMVLLLNAFKGCIIPGKELEFVAKILEEIG